MLIRRRGLVQNILINDVDVTNSTFTSRTTAEGKKLNRSLAEIQSIKGNTLVWNQMLNSEAEYVYASAFSSSMNPLNVKPLLNDKIYISADVKKSTDYSSYDTDAGNRLVLSQSGNTWGGQVSFRTIPKDNEYHRIYGRPTNANATNSALGVQEHGYSAGSVTIKNMMALNLSKMFGVGYEPTAAQFKNWFPLDFYTQDSGRFLNFTATSLVSKDNNLDTIGTSDINITNITGMPHYLKYWNQLAMSSEETTCSSETEIFFSTTTLYNNIEVEHKFYIQADIKKSTDFVASTTENYSQRLTFANSGSSWGSSITVKDVPTDNTYHTVSGITKNNDSRNTNLSIFLVNHTAGYISVKNVMCIDLTKIYGQGKEPSDPAVFKSDFSRWFGRTLTYEPYNDGTTPSGTSSVIFPNGMRSTPVAYDEIKKEGDNWVAYKRIKCLNLGNYTYTYVSDYKMFLGPTLSDGKYYNTNNSQINTKGYPTQWSFSTTNSESIPCGIILTSSNYGTGNKILKIRDLNYTDATALKNALQNHYLNYELTYPVKYILDNPISSLYNVRSQGVEVIMPENGAAPTTSPARIDIRYKTIQTLIPINVTQTHTNLTNNRVKPNSSFTTYVTPDTGCEIYEISIKMGTTDITSTAWNATTKVINIASVTDTVTIECYAMYSMPSDYIQVDGIKNPSDACLNTSHAVNPNNRLEIKTNLVKAASGYTQLAISKSPGMTGVSGSGWYIHTNGNLYCYSTTGNTWVNLDVTTNLGKTFEFVADYYKNTHTIVGIRNQTFSARKTATDSYDFCLFSRNNGAESAQTAGQIINYFHIYDYSTTSYVRYYIPCLNDSGVAGFWDAARGVFQGSSNSTAFKPIVDNMEFEFITFEDANVKQICVTNWGGNYKAGEISNAEAARVTTFSNKFEQNTSIVKFNELRYFTGLTTLTRYVEGQYLDGMQYFGAFNRCSNLEEVTLPTITMNGSKIAALFCRCSKLKTVDMSPITITGTAYLCNICGQCAALTSVVLPTVNVLSSYLGGIYAFGNCTSLLTIDATNVNWSNMSYSNSSNIFGGATSLTRIIGGLSGFRNTENSIKSCPLTHDAAVELLTSLGTVTEARTITLKTSVYNSLTAEEKAIATDKGWTLAYA